MKILVCGVKLCLFFSFLLFTSVAYAQKSNGKIKKNPTAKSAVQEADVKITTTQLEKDVLQEFNEVRKNPQKYTEYLQSYKNSMEGDIAIQSNNVRIKTSEGAAAVEETVNDLKKTQALEILQFSPGLTKAANVRLENLEGQTVNGRNGKDDAPLEVRLPRFGTVTGQYAENISYGSSDARQVVITMLISDGLKSRSLRKNILNTQFKVVGIACSKKTGGKDVCVADFANSFIEKTKPAGTFKIS